MLTYIHFHCNQDITLSDLAEKFHCSETKLNEYLYSHTGLSFADYLNEVRIRLACALLSNPELKISEISKIVRYKSMKTFYRAFKSLKGFSPEEFRQYYFTEEGRKESFPFPSPLMWKIIHYIQLHYNEDLTLSDVAKKFHYSESSLSELCKRQTGQSFIDMLHEIRVFHACSLLLSTDMSVTDAPKPKGAFGGGEDWEKMSEEERQAMFKRMMEHVRKIYKTRPANLEEVKAALDKYGVKVMNMPLDFGDISNPDDETRKEDIEILKMWIEIAAFLGSKSVRVNTGFRSSEKDLNTIVSSYRELAEYGATKGVAVAMENHGGVSADPKNIVKIFEMVNHPNFRICPDFGNFDDDIRYEALDIIFDLNPILVHAKTYDFDEQGNQTRFDFGRCIEIAKKHGYDGYYSVEFEGQGDQFEGVRKTIALLRKYL